MNSVKFFCLHTKYLQKTEIIISDCLLSINCIALIQVFSKQIQYEKFTKVYLKWQDFEKFQI